MIFRIFKSLCTACLGFICLWLFGCGGGGGIPDADTAAEQGILLLGNGTEPQTLDPQIATGVPENHLISALLEGLINYHLTDDVLPEPGVAERWEANEDKSVWTFYLRPDAAWSNGDPVTASDFVYSYERILTPALGAQYAEALYPMKNAREFHKGQITDFSEVGVKALDDRILEITLVGPTAYFLNLLKHYSWYPVHPATIEANGGMLDRSGRWTLPGSFVGNGPFVMDKWLPNQYIRLSRSPTYWDRDVVKLNGIIFFPVDDLDTEFRMFQASALHKTNEVPISEIPRLRKESPDAFHLEPLMTVYFYRLNLNRPPLDNPKVRLALSYAIDRKKLVEKVTLAGQIPATAFVPPMFSNYSPQPVVGYDPEKARALLAEAGYPSGKGFPTLEILHNTHDGHKKIAEAIGAMWSDTLKVSIRPLNKEWKVYLTDQDNGDYDIARAGWGADYADPMTFLDMWTTGNGNNQTGWSDEKFDSLISQTRSAPNEEARIAMLHEAESILMEELPIIPIYWYTRAYLLDTRVKNWFPKALDNRPIKYIYLSE